MSKILLTVMCVLALGLGACGGSGEKAVAGLVDTAAQQRAAVLKAIRVATDAVHDLDGESTDAEVDAAAAAIVAARKAVADADTLSNIEKEEAGKQVSRLERDLDDQRKLIARAREDEVGKLFAALGRPGIADIRAAVRYGAPPTMSGTVPGTPPTTVSDLETAGATGQLGGWRGGTYTAADEAAGTADTVALYTNVEAPGTQPFSGEGGKYGTADGLDTDGNLPIVAGTDATLIASSAFPTGPGIRTHEAGTDGTAEVAGSFDGASGAYVCEPAQGGACTSSVKHGGGYTLAGGTWKFVPATGAMVATTDTEFQYFGWWSRETGDGVRGERLPCRRGRRGGRVRKPRRASGPGDLSRPRRGQFRLEAPGRRGFGRGLHRHRDATGGFRRRRRRGDGRGDGRRLHGGRSLQALVGRAPHGRDRRRRLDRGCRKQHRDHRLVDRRERRGLVVDVERAVPRRERRQGSDGGDRHVQGELQRPRPHGRRLRGHAATMRSARLHDQARQGRRGLHGYRPRL